MTTIRSAREEDYEVFINLLTQAKLPTEGVREHYDSFFIAEYNAAVVGGIGLEIYGDTALLRSAVVRPEMRNMGVGSLLYDHLIVFARERKIKKLVLLTTTADRYFERKGFQRIDRSMVKKEIAESAEFISACPKSAVCMELSV